MKKIAPIMTNNMICLFLNQVRWISSWITMTLKYQMLMILLKVIWDQFSDRWLSREVMANSQDRSVSLRSNQWSCSELAKGASLCASMAGLDLKLDPNKLSKDELKQAIKDPWCQLFWIMLRHIIPNHMSHIMCGKILWFLRFRRRKCWCRIRGMTLDFT